MVERNGFLMCLLTHLREGGREGGRDEEINERIKRDTHIERDRNERDRGRGREGERECLPIIFLVKVAH